VSAPFAGGAGAGEGGGAVELVWSAAGNGRGNLLVVGGGWSVRAIRSLVPRGAVIGETCRAATRDGPVAASIGTIDERTQCCELTRPVSRTLADDAEIARAGSVAGVARPAIASAERLAERLEE
jgi:hypothetical protein